MKKAEIILGIIAIIGFIINIQLLPGGALLTTLSMSLLNIIYILFGFLLFNNIRLRHIFKKNHYKDVNAMQIIGAVFAGLVLSIIVIALLFHLNYWDGKWILLQIGLIHIGLALLIFIPLYWIKKSAFSKQILSRLLIYGGLGVIFYLLPNDAILNYKYKDYPEYIEALKDVREDPDNEDYRKRLNEERYKM